MRRKQNFHFPTRYILFILTGLCIVALFLTDHFDLANGPVHTVAGYVFVPMQKGINKVGSWFSEKGQTLKDSEELVKENEELKEQVEQLTTDLSIVKLESSELESLRSLYELDQKYPSYEKTGARVISKASGNWFSTFTIDKGSDDGIEKDMNVIAGSGLVGIVTEVSRNYAKVRSIIDEASNVSASTVSNSDYCIVSGNLETMTESQTIEFSELKLGEHTIETGEQLVTSNISDKYLPGILVGYITEISQDSNQLTWSGAITPAVDFEHLQEVLVIKTKKESAE